VKTNRRINPLEDSQPDSAGKEGDTSGLQAFAAWQQNSEPGWSAVWVLHREINCHCKN